MVRRPETIGDGLHRIADWVLPQDVEDGFEPIGAVVLITDGIAVRAYVAQSGRSGRRLRETFNRKRTAPEPKRSSNVPFRWEDVERCAWWLHSLTGIARWNREIRKIEDAESLADRDLAQRVDRELNRTLEKAAFAAQHPYVCGACRRRFKSKGGLTRHRRTRHPGDPSTPSSA